MAVTLWIVMLLLAAAGWFLNRPGARRAPLIALGVVEAVFTVWVILTQLATVGYWWLIVTITLGLLVSFRSDLERLRTGREPGRNQDRTGADPAA